MPLCRQDSFSIVFFCINEEKLFFIICEKAQVGGNIHSYQVSPIGLRNEDDYKQKCVGV